MNFLDPALDAYCEHHSTEEASYLRELTEETYAKVQMPIMISGHLQGRFLSMLSHLVRPKTVVEIGTFTGYSALCLAEGLAEGGMVHTIDIDPLSAGDGAPLRGESRDARPHHHAPPACA